VAKNAILDASGSVIHSFLARRGFALAAPTTASFRTNEYGSCGVGVTVKLQDPREVPAARAAISERFGGAGGVDLVTVS
jgi:hypothetical protein